MPAFHARLLCVGRELNLLEIRCAVLACSGYESQSATVSEAEILLRSDQFDLVIVSAWLSEWDRARILEAVGRTPTLVLTQVTFAEDLLAQVARMLVVIPKKPRLVV
jgi:DNA-binding response OmpR family regulator